MALWGATGGVKVARVPERAGAAEGVEDGGEDEGASVLHGLAVWAGGGEMVGGADGGGAVVSSGDEGSRDEVVAATAVD